MSGPNLDSYIEVKDRLVMLYERFPEASLETTYEFVETDGQQYVICNAFVYRTPDDPRPSNGIAWEQIPGRTPYTKGSELMNGQTSAWGRAIVALGISADRGIASANEVRAAEARRTAPDPKQVAQLKADHAAKQTPKEVKRHTLADALTKAFGGERPAIGEYIQEQTGKAKTADLTIAEMDKLIAELTT